MFPLSQSLPVLFVLFLPVRMCQFQSGVNRAGLSVSRSASPSFSHLYSPLTSKTPANQVLRCCSEACHNQCPCVATNRKRSYSVQEIRATFGPSWFWREKSHKRVGCTKQASLQSKALTQCVKRCIHQILQLHIQSILFVVHQNSLTVSRWQMM